MTHRIETLIQNPCFLYKNNLQNSYETPYTHVRCTLIYVAIWLINYLWASNTNPSHYNYIPWQQLPTYSEKVRIHCKGMLNCWLSVSESTSKGSVLYLQCFNINWGWDSTVQVMFSSYCEMQTNRGHHWTEIFHYCSHFPLQQCLQMQCISHFGAKGTVLFTWHITYNWYTGHTVLIIPH